jgi:putative tryptophan/tyrosine transport system substrate-binding protein
MRNFVSGFVALTMLLAPLLGSPADAAPDGKKVWKIGILWHAANLEQEAVMLDPFTQGMRELGYVQGQNLVLEHTFVDENFDRFESRAEELLRRNVDLILASNGPAAAAAKKLTKTVPIVFATSGDPLKLDLIDSFRRPGANVTGLTLFAPELTLKHLELLREFVPALSRVAILWHRSNGEHPATLVAAEQAANSLDIRVVAVAADGPEDLAAAFATIEKAGVGGLIVLVDSMLRVNRASIVAFAARSRLPAVYATRDYVEAGGLMGYGACVPCNFYRAAKYVDEIFRGAKPAEMPVQQPAKFNTLVNLKAAQALGINLPPTVLLRADEVIE